MRKRKAFSLIEVLVVIVVLLVGILSMMRIFPRGFLGLGVTRDYTMAQILARSQIDVLAVNAKDLPRQVLAVKYVFTPNLLIVGDPDTAPGDLGPGGDEM